MNKERVLAFLDAEIQRLQQARHLLSSTEDTAPQSISSGRSSRGGARRGGVRHMSADARRRISEAQKKRWAARKGSGSSSGASQSSGKRHRHLSAEARKRISDAQKRRWAARRKAA